MASLGALFREEPVLRYATLTQGCVFATFNAFWSLLALHLANPALGLGPSGAGLFGLIGVVGAATAPVAGRLADRRGPRVVLIWGTVITLSSFAFLATAGRNSLLGLGLGVVVLNVGATVAMIANQARVYALPSDARRRLNTVYSTGGFLAGALVERFHETTPIRVRPGNK